MASAPSIFLQEPSFKWKNHSHHSPQLPTQNPFAHNHVKIHKNLKKLSINCLFTNDNPAPDRRISKIGFQKLEIKQNPVEIVAETVGNMLKALRRPAAAAAAVVVGLLLMYGPNSALAASGGRMGGRLFSSSSLSQSSAPYHVKIHKKSKKLKQNPVEIMAGNMVKSEKLKQNPVEIMAGNMVKSLGKTAAAAVVEGLLYMCDPNSELAASGGGDGREVVCAVAELQHPADGGRVQAVSQSSAPSQSYSMPPMEAGSGFSFSVPYHAPSPFDEVHVDPTVVVASIFSLSMILFVALVSMPSFLYDGSKGSVLTATDKTSVLKLQVGLLGLGRSLQKDLNRIAEIADTSTSTGLHYVLTETVLALLRHPDYCISGYSSVDVKRSMEEGEKKFNQLSIEERGKFDEETLVNVNNIKKQSSTILRASGFSNEYIVITILVAAEGDHKLPPINNSKDLKDALQKLAAIPSSRTMAVEVLWTPQNEDDTLSERELLEDYPLLRPL